MDPSREKLLKFVFMLLRRRPLVSGRLLVLKLGSLLNLLVLTLLVQAARILGMHVLEPFREMGS